MGSRHDRRRIERARPFEFAQGKLSSRTDNPFKGLTARPKAVPFKTIETDGISHLYVAHPFAVRLLRPSGLMGSILIGSDFLFSGTGR